jgi:hypothetical protein
MNKIECPDDIQPLPDFDAAARNADEWLSDPRNWPNERTVLEDIQRNTELLRADRDREISRARAGMETNDRVRWARDINRQIVRNKRALVVLAAAMVARNEFNKTNRGN